MEEWTEIYAKRGDRILPKWKKLIQKADESYTIAGKDTHIRYLPSGGVVITGKPPVIIAPHPWSIGSLDEEDKVLVREGLIAGRRPWVSEEYRVGDKNKDGLVVGLQLKLKKEGYSYVAVGVNIAASTSSLAEIDPDEKDTWEQLRLQEIEELPKGFGSGGVVADSAGWAWYPLVRLEWEEERVANKFQIVRHSLGHFVTKGDNDQARHFFPPL